MGLDSFSLGWGWQLYGGGGSESRKSRDVQLVQEGKGPRVTGEPQREKVKKGEES